MECFINLSSLALALFTSDCCIQPYLFPTYFAPTHPYVPLHQCGCIGNSDDVGGFRARVFVASEIYDDRAEPEEQETTLHPGENVCPWLMLLFWDQFCESFAEASGPSTHPAGCGENERDETTTTNFFTNHLVVQQNWRWSWSYPSMPSPPTHPFQKLRLFHWEYATGRWLEGSWKLPPDEAVKSKKELRVKWRWTYVWTWIILINNCTAIDCNT